MSGILYIVATPIGNLADISLRAIDILKTVDWIAAEDTRHSQRLLQHYSITTRKIAYHQHNELSQSQFLISELQAGSSVALITDAGTPLLSDPGYYLVQSALAAEIKVVPVPGACAITCALSAAGLATDHFYFGGFLPAKTTARKTLLESVSSLSATLIFYEAPHRILSSLTDIHQTLGERQMVLARELTKKFEAFYRGTAVEISIQLQQNPDQQCGEMVLLIAGMRRSENEIAPETLRILNILLSELPVKQATRLTAHITGAKKNILYDWAIKRNSPGTAS